MCSEFSVSDNLSIFTYLWDEGCQKQKDEEK